MREAKAILLSIVSHVKALISAGKPAVVRRGAGRPRVVALFVWALLFAGLGSGPVLAAQIPANGGPDTLCIVYRSKPDNRPAFRAYLQNTQTAMLEKLKHDGVLASFQILYAPYVNSDSWDAMVVLRFSSYAATKKWQDIERTSPGGLSAEGLRLAQPIDTISADLTWMGNSSEAASAADSVFYIIPYEYRATDEYKNYVDVYVTPQFDGWIREGALSGYRIFMNRYPVGPTWDSLIVLQYRDLQAFGHRGDVLAKVRATLQTNAAWVAISKKKHDIRTESANTIAEALVQP